MGNPSVRLSFQLCLCSVSHPYGAMPVRVAQPVTRLAADTCLTADRRIAISIPARSHTFVEIYYEIISMAIFLSSADSKSVVCSLQAKVHCSKYLKEHLKILHR